MAKERKGLIVEHTSVPLPSTVKWSSDQGRRNYIYGQKGTEVSFNVVVNKRSKVVNDTIKDALITSDWSFEYDDAFSIVSVAESEHKFNISEIMTDVLKHSRFSFDFSKEEVRAIGNVVLSILKGIHKRMGIVYKDAIVCVGTNFEGHYIKYDFRY